MTGQATRETLARLADVAEQPAKAYAQPLEKIGAAEPVSSSRLRIESIMRTFAANVGVVVDSRGHSTGVPSSSSGVPAVRCHRCGWLMAEPDVLVDYPAEKATRLLCKPCVGDLGHGD